MPSNQAKVSSPAFLKSDRRGIRLTTEVLADLLGISGPIYGATFNPSTHTIDIFFYGNGGMQVAEGQEVCFRSPGAWTELDEEYGQGQAEILEEELIQEWESD